MVVVLQIVLASLLQAGSVIACGGVMLLGLPPSSKHMRM